MKIGLVCPYNIAKGGGVKEHVFALQDELVQRGHKVYVITPQPREGEFTEKRDVIFVGQAADFNSPLKTTIQVSAGVNDNIDEVLDGQQFDILHFHEPWVPVLSRQILSRSHAVNVATFHAKLPETLMTRAMARAVTPYTRSVLKYIHEFTAVSEAAAEYVCSLTDQPVALIPNGIDLDRFKVPRARKDASAGPKTIFYVGRLEQRKGVKCLLESFVLLKQTQPDVRLIIAGDGPDREKLEAYVEDNEIKDVRFVGFISEDEKVEYLQTSDLFCSPALYGESFGIVLLEAMATGLVTVAGNNPGYASVMKGLGAISLVNPKDSAEFARRLDLLLHENDLRSLWRQWAKEELPQYSYKVIVDQYEEVYKQGLEQHA